MFVSPETENGLVGYSEPLRRFIQHEGFTPQVNEIQNTMPSWIPGEDHLINFQKGDPYTKVDEGYARLPGAGWCPYPHVFTPVGAEGQINTPQKYVACLERRAAKGQCRSQPYLGCREFAAEFRLATDADTPLDVTENLGRMLYDIVFSAPGGKKPVFFDAKLVSGVLNTRPEDVLTDAAARAEVLACSYKR
jgi:hypothetical protein